MLSLRLKTVASLVKKGSTVLDIGTDHAYLPIFLEKNGIAKNVIASDISSGALEIAKANIAKYSSSVKLILSDGLSNIDEKYDTITISGMGSSTIIKILSGQKLPDNIILSSNNNLYELRLFMNQNNYFIKDEIVVKDHNKYYDIISYEKGFEKLDDITLRYGKSNNKEYYKYLYDKEYEIYHKLSLKYRLKKRKNLKKLHKLIK